MDSGHVQENRKRKRNFGRNTFKVEKQCPPSKIAHLGPQICVTPIILEGILLCLDQLLPKTSVCHEKKK